MKLSEFEKTMNLWGESKIPFLFIIDFELQRPLIFRLNEINPGDLAYEVNGFTNSKEQSVEKAISLERFPISANEYETKFKKVVRHLEYGDSFLTNLTVSTEVKMNRTLREVFHLSHAKYKLLLKDEFLVFSPETFVKIDGDRISAYPMKGTIDAAIPNAKERILNDKKELAEHVTIVDLIRNDLSQVAHNVTVTRFRYIDELKTASKNLYQVSSEIAGELKPSDANRLGSILLKLLPAGSVSGAPKPKTMEIIRAVEGEDRGYYTGIFGYFNGQMLDSGVMIRFIENRSGRFFYRSGGGITTQSVAAAEYQETIDKVYVPVA
jgi:para-aminobenzoate synthetase component 1